MSNNDDDETSNKRLKTSEQGVTILVTGGCGYIGTHTIVCLLEQGYNVVVVDNLANSSKVSLDRVTEIAKLDDEARKKRLIFHQVDLCDKEALRKVFETSPKFQACIHFAGLKVSREERFVCFVQNRNTNHNSPGNENSFFLGGRRKRKDSSQILSQQSDWDVFSLGTHGRIQLPLHCFFFLGDRVWSS